VDGEFKALGLMAERNTLMDGAAERAHARNNNARLNNDELLDGALSTQQTTTGKLKDALTQMEQTKQTGQYTAATLEQDREKIKRIDQVRARVLACLARLGQPQPASPAASPCWRHERCVATRAMRARAP